MSRPTLLDSSYLIDLERETAAGKVGSARTFLSSLRGRTLVVSIVSVEETLGGRRRRSDSLCGIAAIYQARLHLTQARRCALLQRRASQRLGENDALVATAESLDADIVGADRTAFERLGERYLRFR